MAGQRMQLLNDNERAALAEIQRKVNALFPVVSYTIFGSRARGDHQADSDIDLLIVTERELTMSERLTVSDVLHQVNMRYGTLFSRTIVDRRGWTEGPYTVLPIHRAVEQEGVPV